LKNGKTAITFAYDVEKKRTIYQNDRGKKLHSNIFIKSCLIASEKFS
jgi:hypothetical protein